MSIACDATSLVSGAACLECSIPPGLQKPVIISLLCKIANMNCDPTSLVAGAACLECGIPPGMQDAITNYLLCQIANNTSTGAITQSATYALTEATPLSVNFAHGLSAKPSYIHAVLLCTATDANTGFVSGQEIEAYTLMNTTGPNCAIGSYCDSAKIYLSFDGSSHTSLNFSGSPNGPIASPSSMSNFSLKVYYHA